jgi:hypothetical protein
LRSCCNFATTKKNVLRAYCNFATTKKMFCVAAAILQRQKK